jgi:hypothetical protein
MIEEIIQQFKEVRAADFNRMENIINKQYEHPSTRGAARSNARIMEAFKKLHLVIQREKFYEYKK